jgi:hypothetical protein
VCFGRFGDGYTVTLHLQGLSHNRYSIAQSFLAQFPGSVIKVSVSFKVGVKVSFANVAWRLVSYGQS